MITPHQYAALLLRLFALWLLISAVRIALLAYTVRSSAQDGVTAAYTVAALYGVAALLCWCFPMALAKRVLGAQSAQSAQAAQSAQGDASGAAAVAFIAAGLAIIALQALAPVASYLAMLAMLLATDQAERLLALNVHIDGLIGLGMLAVGATLIVKCQSLARVARPRT